MAISTSTFTRYQTRRLSTYGYVLLIGVRVNGCGRTKDVYYEYQCEVHKSGFQSIIYLNSFGVLDIGYHFVENNNNAKTFTTKTSFMYYRAKIVTRNSIYVTQNSGSLYRCSINVNRRSTTCLGLLWSAHITSYCCAMSTVGVTSSSSITTSINHQPQHIAVGQVCATNSKWNNLINVAMCAGWAASSSSSSVSSDERKCCMLFLPECFGFLGSNAEDTLRAAEPSTTEMKANPDIVNQYLINIVRDCTTTVPMNVVPSNIPTFDSLHTMEDEYELSLIDGICTIAQESNLWISAGSIHVRCSQEDSTTETNDISPQLDGTSPTDRVYNTHLIVDNRGTIRSEYRKIYLFDVCIPEKNVNLQESKTTRPGRELIICRDSPIGM
jgi:Carbon-nitrogen hydrolase